MPSFASTPKKCQPITSVYVPSVPGAQFHLRYSINRPPPNSRYLFFRMNMNGRQIVSWGMKSQAIQNQIVSHAFYEPDSKWHFRDSGVIYKRDGVEKRFFHFAPHFETSAAMDGGLIDVQVFRSKGRIRRAPELQYFRSQDKYGITSPTGGLVELPEDLTFYDWVLVDPIDSPFATFRFFYRTWASLKTLNITSGPHYEELVATSNRQYEHLPARPKIPVHTYCGEGDHGKHGLFGFGSLDGSVFEDCDMTNYKSNGKRKAEKAFYLTTPPKLAPPPSVRTKIPQPRKLLRDSRQDPNSMRSLPVLPDVEHPLRRASPDSARAPSVTPSLLPYMEESSGGDEFEIGVARKVMLPSLSQELDDTPSHPFPTLPQAQLSSSEHEATPPSNSGMEIYKRVGLHEYIAAVVAAEATAESFGNMNISEGEWLKRSPSPLRRKQGRLDLNKRGGRMIDEQTQQSPLKHQETSFI
ncbi:hypothetical protein CH35J_011608 [Colletotrichum higginsianum]|nr:hypothetical protein CH35J_011608 [Colletotrichum higginsianum]